MEKRKKVLCELPFFFLTGRSEDPPTHTHTPATSDGHKRQDKNIERVSLGVGGGGSPSIKVSKVDRMIDSDMPDS